jgi:hypothetical protein
MAQQTTIELIAGHHPNGEIIAERVLVSPQPEANSYLLLKSPLFVRGIASGDVIQQMDKPKGAFKVLQHGGNLCVRVFSREPNSVLEQEVTSAIEKLGGDRDIQQGGALVYSIHVSCGFETIEALLNNAVAKHSDCGWVYGNVYDPESGEPLNWWQPIIAPE